MTETSTIGPQSVMREVLEAYPGAQRALFRRYHIGGCSSCGFQLEETLAHLCQRNNDLDVEEVLEHIRDSHEQDSKVLISPVELAQLLQQQPPPQLLDVRSREEWETVRIEGATLMSNPILQEILSQWPRHAVFVIYDHAGRHALDAAAYFLGHGFTKVRCLDGGIDAWSLQVDPKIRRYRLG